MLGRICTLHRFCGCEGHVEVVRLNVDIMYQRQNMFPHLGKGLCLQAVKCAHPPYGSGIGAALQHLPPIFYAPETCAVDASPSAMSQPNSWLCTTSHLLGTMMILVATSFYRRDAHDDNDGKYKKTD
jgi:hypothetical protein